MTEQCECLEIKHERVGLGPFCYGDNWRCVKCNKEFMKREHHLEVAEDLEEENRKLKNEIFEVCKHLHTQASVKKGDVIDNAIQRLLFLAGSIATFDDRKNQE